ncbi:MAG: hypothetical protein ACK5CW_12590 [Verrucomicrobiota bacterium]|jgi:hypothetical protein
MNVISIAATISLMLSTVLPAGTPLAAVRRDTLESELRTSWKSLDSPEQVLADFHGRARSLSPSDDVAASALTAAAVRQWPNDFVTRSGELCESQPLLAPIVAATAAGMRPDFAYRIANECKRAVRRSTAFAGNPYLPAASSGKQTAGEGKASVATGKEPVGTGKAPIAAPEDIDTAIDAAVRAALENGDVGGWLWAFPGMRPEFVGSPLDIFYRPMKFPDEPATTFEPAD